MKKFLVIALVAVLSLSVLAFVACEQSQTVEGEYSYAAWDYTNNALSTTNKYGCKVKVTVKGGVITALEVEDDTATYYNITDSWDSKATWTNGKQAVYDAFIGAKVDDINKITVATNQTLVTDPYVIPVGQPSGITGADSALTVSGATQSSGRLILAVQNALSKLGK